MQIGDIVLTPNENSKSYNVGIVKSNYYYDKEAEKHFFHGRKVKWMQGTISRDNLPQSMVYSLVAYRTIFRLKYEEEFMNILSKSGIEI